MPNAADQYVLDYARIFGIPAIVFRMSCIYGQRQYGTEDQGWIAHFLRAALAEEPITVYGTGKQLRDVLFVTDVIDALLLAQQHVSVLRGRAFNIGGGPQNTASLIEVLDLIEELAGVSPRMRFADWRPGDQPWYVSDIRAFGTATGWQPRIRSRDGMRRLLRWLCEWTGRTYLPTELHGASACVSR